MLGSPLIVFTDKVTHRHTDTQTHRQTDRQTKVITIPHHKICEGVIMQGTVMYTQHRWENTNLENNKGLIHNINIKIRIHT